MEGEVEGGGCPVGGLGQVGHRVDGNCLDFDFGGEVGFFAEVLEVGGKSVA